MKTFLRALFFLLPVAFCEAPACAQRIMENLDRGLIAIPTRDNKVYIGWRLFAYDPNGLGFNVYRTTDNKTVRLNAQPVRSSTNFIDEHPELSKENSYFIRPVLKGK
jgi:rhamnogalacturonan endolyase